ncbi:MAG: choice-of-anchor tandem repeat GloVer-containing protein, partial [Terriglobales bacterium]
MRSSSLILSVLLLIAALPAQAQTETVLYSFCSQPNCSDGAYPTSSLTPDDKGNFYGTTWEGGLGCAGAIYGCGTVFELSPNGSGGWNETVLYSFTGGEDEVSPLGPVIFDSVGNLYGTAWPNGQGIGFGVVFELSPVGGGWTESVLYRFTGFNDAYPEDGLIMDSASNLYGTTQGTEGSGEVFELSPSRDGWTQQVIYNAGSGYSGLTMDAAGNIFGTEFLKAWTVFELSPDGNGGWTPTVIYTFNNKGGSNPQGALTLDKAGDLYGTTENGGKYGAPLGYGTVYRLYPGKKGKWTEKVLHYFKGGTHDGKYPLAGIVFDAAGNIYGTTVKGGVKADHRGGV